MTTLFRVLAVLALAVLVFAVILSSLDNLRLRQENASPASSTAKLPPQTEVAARATESAIAPTDYSTPLDQRPLDLPVLSPGDPCPTSNGSREIVPPEPYIFCATCLWFGRGSVYFALAWHDNRNEDATFSLDRVPYEDDAYRAKTPWVSKPDYSGPILISGRQLDGSGENKLRFPGEGYGPSDQLRLEAAGYRGRTRWSFWPSGIWVPGPGCYGVQIDTLAGTDVIIFAATRSVQAPDQTPSP